MAVENVDLGDGDLLSGDLDVLDGGSDEAISGKDGAGRDSGRSRQDDSRTPSRNRGRDDRDSKEGRRPESGRQTRDSKQDEPESGDSLEDWYERLANGELDESEDDERPEARGERVEDEEELEDKEPAGAFNTRPTFGQIKKEFPDLFKRFPQLRDSFFREQKYTELFPSLEDAQEAVESVQNYDYLREHIEKGDSGELLGILSNYNGQVRDKFVMGFLPTLYKQDKDLFFEATRPVVKNAIRAMYHDANRTGQTDLAEAAMAVHKYFFQAEDPNQPLPPSARMRQERQEDDPEKKKFEEDKKRFFESRQQETARGVHTYCAVEIGKHLDGLIDPKDRLKLSNFDKKGIRRDALELLGNALENDRQHMSLMNSLWKRAANSGYPLQLRQRLVSAYLTKAKLVLPQIVKHVISEAKGGGKRRQRDDSDHQDEIRGDTRRRPSGGPQSPSRGKTPNAKDVDWRATSDEDFLNDKVTLKR